MGLLQRRLAKRHTLTLQIQNHPEVLASQAGRSCRAPRRDLRRFFNNTSPSKATWSSRLCSMNSRARVLWAREVGVTGLSNVPWFSRCRGPPLACLALESSLQCVNCMPSSQRLPKSSPHGVDEGLLCCSIQHLLCWPSSTTTTLLAQMHCNARQVSLWNGTTSRGLVSNIRGASKNNFHARISCSTLPAARAWRLPGN